MTGLARRVPALRLLWLVPVLVAVAPVAHADSLAVRQQALEQQRLSLKARRDAHNAGCGQVAEGSPQADDCARAQAALMSDIAAWRAADDQLAADFEAERLRIIGAMDAWADAAGWDGDSRRRLDAALRALAEDGDPATAQQVVAVWHAIRSRGADVPVARAARASGVGSPVGAGRQSNQDCALFALANAAGLPYGVVAARAAALVRDGAWREAADRADPSGAIARRGLTGGEVVLLAEALGQVDVVPREAFAATLAGGTPVILNLVPPDGDVDAGHAAVLLASFRFDGQTWYDLIDSNEVPGRHLYLSDGELGILLKENGVVYRADPGTTAPLLR